MIFTKHYRFLLLAALHLAIAGTTVAHVFAQNTGVLPPEQRPYYDYALQVQKKIASGWAPPQSLGHSVAATVQVRIESDTNSSFREETDMLQSSGDKTFDRSVEDACYFLDKLPLVPDNHIEKFYVVCACSFDSRKNQYSVKVTDFLAESYRGGLTHPTPAQRSLQSQRAFAVFGRSTSPFCAGFFLAMQALCVVIMLLWLGWQHLFHERKPA